MVHQVVGPFFLFFSYILFDPVFHANFIHALLICVHGWRAAEGDGAATGQRRGSDGGQRGGVAFALMFTPIKDVANLDWVVGGDGEALYAVMFRSCQGTISPCDCENISPCEK